MRAVYTALSFIKYRKKGNSNMLKIKKLFKRLFIKKDNDCKKCPYYGSYYDSFIGDGDEWCCAGICGYGDIIGCNYPLFIRHLFRLKVKIREAIAEYRAEKHIKKEFAEMERLGLSEDEYYSKVLEEL